MSERFGQSLDSEKDYKRKQQHLNANKGTVLIFDLPYHTPSFCGLGLSPFIKADLTDDLI